MAYGDAQRYRLGVKHNLIPVNRAKCVVRDYHRDGAMRIGGNYGRIPAYTPSSSGYWTAQTEVMEQPLSLEGAMRRYDSADDNFRAAGKLWSLLSEDKKKLLIDDTATDMDPVTENIKYRHAVHCYLADPEYGTRLTKAVGIDMNKVLELSQLINDDLIQANL